MSIQLNGINCFYGAHQALFDITLDCPQGETLVLLGPSGAGKSSLLRVLNLLEMPSKKSKLLKETAYVSFTVGPDTAKQYVDFIKKHGAHIQHMVAGEVKE
mgnify:CR=1 FL=1